MRWSIHVGDSSFYKDFVEITIHILITFVFHLLVQAKGFVQNSFYTGLSAVEFFFHTMGGREGLVDTAVKTADTGYMSRRLMKTLEDLYIHYDNTVRNASSCIIQFMYGDDGMDPSQMEAKDGQPLNFDRLLMKAKATCPAIEQKSMSTDEIYQKTLEVLVDHGIVSEGEENNKVPQLAEQKSFGQSLLEFVCKKMKSLEETQKRLKLDGEEDADACLESDENVALNASGLTSKQLEVFLRTCLARYNSKKIESGTAIGAIGAQSIGEPGTQMTLKTFHFAGVASMNVTLGVPRIKEIIDASKDIKTPIIDAKLERNNDDAKSAIVVKGRIEKTLLGQVAKSVKIVMSSRRASIVVTLDMKVIQASLLSIDAYSVKQSILQTKGLKLKEKEKENEKDKAKGQVKVLNTSKLEVIPFVDKKNLHFELHSLKNRLPTVVVKGINTVERVVISNEKEHKERCQLFVEGTGLLAVMGTEGIDGSKTISNNIQEVYRTLGIEVARRLIIDEIKKIVEAYGITIDIRHMMLLAEIMTYKGEILGITRFGMQKMKESVLMLASFEKTADHLFNASVNGRVDKIEGVSECIIMGIPMQFGTGLLKVRQSMPPVELKYGPDPIIS
ncbi:DNA-directed RNA polymerase [Lithospermum erythrorhizon]|uniref:DNA-directed RNA polymerase n=1 Tax=Lithospermum erythrorhizon TaxID=34254 RepID=A0AAV3NM99_LITER